MEGLIVILLIFIVSFIVRIVNSKDGETPLIVAAAANRNPAVIETLIKHGADVKAKDSSGKTALDYAQENLKIYRTDAYWLLNQKMYE